MLIELIQQKEKLSTRPSTLLLPSIPDPPKQSHIGRVSVTRVWFSLGHEPKYDTTTVEL